MPNKQFSKLNELDRKVRQTLRLGMNDGTFLRIEYVYGFEKFNTRPYHNYETWAGGWRIVDPNLPYPVESEDLDDAIDKWVTLHHENRPEKYESFEGNKQG